MKKMYIVINTFKDSDDGKIYKKGDKYNSNDESRIKTLSTKENKYNRIFIVKNRETQEVDERNGITNMTVPQLKKALDQLNVEYKASAKKEELIELLESVASDEPPKEGD